MSWPRMTFQYFQGILESPSHRVVKYTFFHFSARQLATRTIATAPSLKWKGAFGACHLSSQPAGLRKSTSIKVNALRLLHTCHFISKISGLQFSKVSEQVRKQRHISKSKHHSFKKLNFPVHDSMIGSQTRICVYVCVP
jgi:hypothetical protein